MGSQTVFRLVRAQTDRSIWEKGAKTPPPLPKKRERDVVRNACYHAQQGTQDQKKEMPRHEAPVVLSMRSARNAIGSKKKQKDRPIMENKEPTVGGEKRRWHSVDGRVGALGHDIAPIKALRQTRKGGNKERHRETAVPRHRRRHTSRRHHKRATRREGVGRKKKKAACKGKNDNNIISGATVWVSLR